MPDPVRPVAPREEDPVCEHGTAMDVHCCNCHSGFIFDRHHECKPSVEDALKTIGERAMLAASDPHGDAAHYRKALAEICNLALVNQRLAVSPVPWAGSGSGSEDLTRVDKGTLSDRTGSTASTDCGYQDVECWERQLRAAGWLPWNTRTGKESRGSTTWKSPSGLLYRGPYKAWRVMRDPSYERTNDDAS